MYINNTLTTTSQEMNLIAFSKTLTSLNKEGKHKECLHYFREHYRSFTPQSIAENEYVISAVLTALKGTQDPDRLQKGLSFLEKFRIELSGQRSERLLTSLAWLFYSHLKDAVKEQPEMEEEDDILLNDENVAEPENLSWEDKALELLPLLQVKETDFCRNAFSYLFTAMIRYQKTLPVKNYSFLKKWCEAVKVEHLSDKAKTIAVRQDDRERRIELSSDRELYFVAYSKALNALQLHDDCIRICRTAFNTIQKFHHQQDVWMRRRLALSLAATGNSEQAIIEMKQVLASKNEWYIRAELAEMLLETGKAEEALSIGSAAMLMPGDISYKVGLIFILGRALLQLQQPQEAAAHFQLSYIIRRQKGWKIPDPLFDAILSVAGELPSTENPEELQQKLLPVWKQLTPELSQKSDQRLQGTVSRILHQNDRGTNGYISYDNNKSIYFTIPGHLPLSRSIHIGMSVSFTEKLAPDGKRTIAKKIQPVQ